MGFPEGSNMKAPGDTDFPFGAIPAFIYISSLKQEGGICLSVIVKMWSFGKQPVGSF